MNNESKTYLGAFLISIITIGILFSMNNSIGPTPVSEQPTQITKCVGLPGACILTTQPGVKVVYRDKRPFGEQTNTVVYNPNEPRNEHVDALMYYLMLFGTGAIAVYSGLSLLVSFSAKEE